MTTVIMISNDNSVIITNSDTSDTVSPVTTSNMSPDSGSGSSGDSPDFRGHVTKPGPIRSKNHHQSRKLSVSTVESDSEELNNSSSSTTSTLSSRYVKTKIYLHKVDGSDKFAIKTNSDC